MKIKRKNYKWFGDRRKEYHIINDSEVILETRKPKWYSSEINFQYNNKLYEIKKSSFWSLSYNIFELKRPIGKIDFIDGFIRLKNKNAKYIDFYCHREKTGKWFSSEKRYVLNKKDLNLVKREKTGKWFSSVKRYFLNKKDWNSVLTIYYDYKGPTQNINVSFNDVNSTDYVLLVCLLFKIDNDYDNC